MRKVTGGYQGFLGAMTTIGPIAWGGALFGLLKEPLPRGNAPLAQDDVVPWEERGLAVQQVFDHGYGEYADRSFAGVYERWGFLMTPDPLIGTVSAGDPILVYGWCVGILNDTDLTFLWVGAESFLQPLPVAAGKVLTGEGVFFGVGSDSFISGIDVA